MGQVTIEIPQNVNLRFIVQSKEVADEILRLVKNSKNKNPEKKLEIITLNLPYNLDDVDENEAVGIWADREESAEEIARRIRDRNNGKI